MFGRQFNFRQVGLTKRVGYSFLHSVLRGSLNPDVSEVRDFSGVAHGKAIQEFGSRQMVPFETWYLNVPSNASRDQCMRRQLSLAGLEPRRYEAETMNHCAHASNLTACLIEYGFGDCVKGGIDWHASYYHFNSNASQETLLRGISNTCNHKRLFSHLLDSTSPAEFFVVLEDDAVLDHDHYVLRLQEFLQHNREKPWDLTVIDPFMSQMDGMRPDKLQGGKCDEHIADFVGGTPVFQVPQLNKDARQWNSCRWKECSLCGAQALLVRRAGLRRLVHAMETMPVVPMDWWSVRIPGTLAWKPSIALNPRGLARGIHNFCSKDVLQSAIDRGTSSNAGLTLHEPHGGQRTLPTVDSYRPQLDDLTALATLRNELADASLDVILEAHGRSEHRSLINISKICAIYRAALDMVGLRGVVTSLTEVYQFQAAFDDVVRSRSAPIRTTIEDNGRTDFTIFYHAVFIDRPFDGLGSLYWLRHWLGMFLAEQVLDRPVSLHGDLHGHSGGYIDTSEELMHELMSTIKVPGAYYQNAHSHLHGAVWQSLALTLGQQLQTFPVDIVRKWCYGGNMMEADVNAPIVLAKLRLDTPPPLDGPVWSRGVAMAQQNCVHGIGHGAYFSVAAQELSMMPSAQTPLYPPEYKMSSRGVSQAERICKTAPSARERDFCLTGLRHSLQHHSK